MAELSEVKLTWGKEQHAAQIGINGEGLLLQLCPIGDGED